MKKRFYIYASWEEQFDILDSEEKATMLMNLFKHAKGEEPTLNTTGLKLVWAGIKYLLEQDDIKYQAAVQRAKNTKPQTKNMAPQTNIMEPQIKDMEPQNNLRNHSDNVNVNVNVNVNDNVNDNDKGNENECDNVNTLDINYFLDKIKTGEQAKTLYKRYPKSSSIIDEAVDIMMEE